MHEPSPAPLKPTTLARAAGISVPYASQILSGSRTPPLKMAARIYRLTGHRFGPLSAATKEEAETLTRLAEAQ